MLLLVLLLLVEVVAVAVPEEDEVEFATPAGVVHEDNGLRVREWRALQEARNEFGDARPFILTLESRLPYPEMPTGVAVLPAWEWILQGS
jgi:hypothetical protein